MNRSHYNAVREAVIKAMPEVLELKFGCEILVETSRAGIQKTTITNFMSAGGFMTLNFGPILEGKITEILGRPIRLADVLLAIEHQINNISLNGPIFDRAAEIPMADILNRWNLRKDSLEDQSEETIEFLYPILK